MQNYVIKEKEILKRNVENLEVKPVLGSIIVGERPDSKIYNNIKKRVITEAGMGFDNVVFEDGILIEDIAMKVKEFALRGDIHGILIQLPLNREFYSKKDENYLINLIPSEKDVDGLTIRNQSLLFQGEDKNTFLQPCTPSGIVDYITSVTSIVGKNITVVGRSQLLGNSLGQMLMREDANVTLLHSRSDVKISDYLNNNECDIMCLCAGKKNLLNEIDIPKNSDLKYIIDAGINRGEGKSIEGDCTKDDYEKITNRGIYVSPVPGGVGTLTTLTLAKNLYKAYLLQSR